jgi:hypothetical protein
MKMLLVVIIFLLFSSLTFSQQSHPLLDKVDMPLNDEELIEEIYVHQLKYPDYNYVYEYTENNKLHSITRSHYENSEWTHFTKDTYAYYESGKTKSINKQFWINESWQDSLRALIKYNDHFLITELIYEQKLNSEWVRQSEQFIEYDDQDREVKNSLNYYIDNEIYYSITTEQSYFENGKDSVRKETTVDHNSKLIKKWTGNIQGRLIEYEESYYNNDNELVNYLITSYVFNIAGDTSVAISKRLNYDTVENSLRETTVYQGDNQIISQTTERWKKEEWQNFNRTEFEYNSNGSTLSTVIFKMER